MSTIRKGTISKGTISTGFAFKSELAVTGELKFNLLGDYGFTPSENVAPSTSLLSGTISSGSASGAVTFTLDDNANGRISIASTGDKTFSISTTGVGFNHSTSPSHTFKVRAVGSDGAIISRTGTIVLTDVDNAPTITATDFAGNRNNFHADVLPGVAIAGGNGNELRSISTDKQSVFTLSGSQADDHLLIPDTDGLGAVVTAKRIIPHGGSDNTEFGPSGVETPAAGDATYTAEEKGDTDTDTSTAKTLTSNANLSGSSTVVIQPDVAANSYFSTGFSASSVLESAGGSHTYHYDSNRATNFNTKFFINYNNGQIARRSGQTIQHGDTFSVVAQAARFKVWTPADISELQNPGADDESFYSILYVGGFTSSAGHSPAIDLTNDTFMLEEVPVAVSKTNAFSVGSGPKITVSSGGGGDSFGNTISGIDNPTINMYVGDTFTITNSAHATKEIYVKTEVVGGTTLGLPTDSSVTNNGSASVAFTPVSKGVYYYVDATDSRNYGIIQVHSRDIRNPFKTGTPVVATNLTIYQGSVISNVSPTQGRLLYVRNVYQDTGNESDAGKISLHTTKSGAEANNSRLDITSTTGGQTQSFVGMILRPVAYRNITFNVQDTIAPSFTSSATTSLIEGLKADTSTLYNAAATDAGTGVSSYSIVANTSGLNLEIGQYQSPGNVTFDGAQTITAGQTYSLTVRATDGAGNSTDQAVTITGTSASTTHFVTHGINSPVNGVHRYGYSGQEYSALSSATGSISPNVNVSGFSASTKIVACYMHESNYNGYNASGADRYRFYITFTGDHRNNSNKNQIVVTSGSTSQTFTFASASTETYSSAYYQSDGGFTRYTWNFSNPTSGNSIWDVIANLSGGSQWSIEVS